MREKTVSSAFTSGAGLWKYEEYESGTRSTSLAGDTVRGCLDLKLICQFASIGQQSSAERNRKQMHKLTPEHYNLKRFAAISCCIWPLLAKLEQGHHAGSTREEQHCC
jgi:hypothetical protein